MRFFFSFLGSLDLLKGYLRAVEGSLPTNHKIKDERIKKFIQKFRGIVAGLSRVSPSLEGPIKRS